MAQRRELSFGDAALIYLGANTFLLMLVLIPAYIAYLLISGLVGLVF
jgi:hypothetical protein